MLSHARALLVHAASRLRPLRYALFGAGSAARLHLADIAKQPGVELVGIADPADRASWRIAAEYARVPHFRGGAALLRHARPDLVSICTPPRFHAELSVLALRAGAHVVCEKPMATTLAEAEAMERARAEAGRLGAVNFSYRNPVAFRFARDVIARREIGRLTRVNVAYLQSFLAAGDAGWSWRSDIETAGFGALGDLGVHMIDAARFVTGREFVRVVGLSQTLVSARLDGGGKERAVTTDSNAAFLAELSGNVLATFETSQIASGYGDFFRLEISGDAGSVVVDSEEPDRIRLFSGAELNRRAIWQTLLPVHEIPADWPPAHEPPSPGAIVPAIRGAHVAYPTFADGLAAQRVLHALNASIASGAWVSVSHPS
jgi:predicted dehydrogenase